MAGASARHEFEAMIAGTGTAGALMAARDWNGSAIGSPERWPASLRSAVGICLLARSPMAMFWGSRREFLYNDACIPILGSKHPHAMGRPALDHLAELWPVIGERIDGALHRREASWSDDLLLMPQRHGFVEETYFTVSFSPIPDGAGAAAGALCVLQETTGRVLGERRLRLLSTLGEAAAGAESAERACAVAADLIARDPADVPFAILYLLDDDGRTARLAGTTRLPAGTAASPEVVELDGAVWPLGEVAVSGQARLVEQLPEPAASLDVPLDAEGRWPISGRPRAALVLPIARGGRPLGLLVVGISPWLALDAEYRAFFGLVAGQVANAVAGARAYADERRRAEALAQLDQTKTAFFSDVSHEFRTPLTLLLGPLHDAMADPAGLPAAQLERVDLAHRNALRLLKLVNAMLDFSRIEAGRVQAVFRPVDLAAVTADLASVFRAAVEHEDLRLVVDCPPLPEPVFVDLELWEKVVLNLVSNAFKFTRQGEIRVALRAVGERCELSVSDTGTGIPASELPHVFERFHRVPREGARTHEGTGIGLTLVDELVRLHDGTLGVDSEVGCGSTFTVRLPFGSAHLPPGAVRGGGEAASDPGARPYVEEALRWLPDGAGPGAASPNGHDAAPADPGAPRVLVVDDNADMRAYLGQLLARHWVVETCPDGSSALAAVAERPPALVLTDVMMPGVDGLQVLRALRDDERTAHLPVMMLSARSGAEAIVEGMEAGADDYLLKPFSAQELIARVRTNLQLAELRMEVSQARAHASLARAHRDFMNMAAHELRSPLGVVRGCLSMLHDGTIEAGSADEPSIVQTALAKATEAVVLLEEVLLAARLESDQLVLRPAMVDLREVVRQAMTRTRPLADLTGEALHLHLPDAAVPVSADRRYLDRILDNLIVNAVKHGAGGGVCITVPAEGGPVVRVRDAGPGVPTELRERVFEPFVRASRHISGAGGPGLGLGIARRLAELHGGSLTLDDAGGPGATFVLALPPA